VVILVTVLYPGSFDPITNGHLDIIRRIIGFGGNVVVGVMHNVYKESSFLFSQDQRVSLIRAALKEGLGRDDIGVVVFSGLLVDVFEEYGADVVARGARYGGEFEREVCQACANRAMNPRCETIFIPSSPENAFISSSRVVEIARFGGDVSGMVPECVSKALKYKF